MAAGSRGVPRTSPTAKTPSRMRPPGARTTKPCVLVDQRGAGLGAELVGGGPRGVDDEHVGLEALLARRGRHRPLPDPSRPLCADGHPLHEGGRRMGAHECLTERSAPLGHDDHDALAGDHAVVEQVPRRPGAHHAGGVVVLEGQDAVVRARRQHQRPRRDDLDAPLAGDEHVVAVDARRRGAQPHRDPSAHHGRPERLHQRLPPRRICPDQSAHAAAPRQIDRRPPPPSARARTSGRRSPSPTVRSRPPARRPRAAPPRAGPAPPGGACPGRRRAGRTPA